MSLSTSSYYSQLVCSPSFVCFLVCICFIINAHSRQIRQDCPRVWRAMQAILSKIYLRRPRPIQSLCFRAYLRLPDKSPVFRSSRPKVNRPRFALFLDIPFFCSTLHCPCPLSIVGALQIQFLVSPIFGYISSVNKVA